MCGGSRQRVVSLSRSSSQCTEPYDPDSDYEWMEDYPDEGHWNEDEWWLAFWLAKGLLKE